MKVKLNFTDRIKILSLLPTKGSFFIINLVEDFKKIVAFSEDDIKEYKIKFDDNNIKWTGQYDKEVEIGETVLTEINKTILELNKKNDIGLDMLPLINKVVTTETMEELNKQD